MKSTSIIAVLGLAAAFAAPAAAQMRGGYLGFSAGQSDLKFAGCNNPCDSKGRDYKFYGGFQLHPNIALEVGYADMGKGTFGSSNIKATAWDATAVGSWGIPMGGAAGMGIGLSIFGRLGAYSGEAKQTTPSTGAEVKHGSTNVTFGAGIQADLSRILAARVEWQRYSKMGGGGLNQTADVDAWTVGALWKF